ncbi:MAG: HIT family protein [Nanoarchaeota archaeon]|nr:HIT family protein [Nanoarchaeota archaeon]
MVEECIFCKIVEGKVPAQIVYNDDNFIGIFDVKPKAEGHSLIISKKHFRNLLDMPSSLGNEMIDGIKAVSLKLIKEGKAEGFNIIFNTEPAAGQAVFHVHCHIIPRKTGDGLKGIV